MEKTLKIKKPDMPTHWQYEKKAIGQKQDGIFFSEPDDSKHIKHFTQEEAAEYAAFMKETFMEHWKSFQEQG